MVSKSAVRGVATPNGSKLKGLAHMNTLTKVCLRCKVDKPLTEYYGRSGTSDLTEPGHYVSECKTCMKQRSKTTGITDPYQPRVLSETLAIEQLLDVGIFAVPGKAIAAKWVDVVAWGCVWIEVKYSRLEFKRGVKKFTFMTSKQQQQRGFLADLVMLICDYGDDLTYHLFEANHPVFYMGERVKSGFTFTPDAMEAKKHGDNRVVMTQPMMDEAKDRWDMIGDYTALDPRRRMKAKV
jgi:hypothetical protein